MGDPELGGVEGNEEVGCGEQVEGGEERGVDDRERDRLEELRVVLAHVHVGRAPQRVQRVLRVGGEGEHVPGKG